MTSLQIKLVACSSKITRKRDHLQQEIVAQKWQLMLAAAGSEIVAVDGMLQLESLRTALRYEQLLNLFLNIFRWLCGCRELGDSACTD